MPIVLAASGIALIAAEEIRIQMYLNNPCPEGIICDKVIAREQGWGVFLIILGGVAFAIDRVIRPSQATRPSMN